MAPPRNRRPGFSRRIQISLFIGYVIAVVGVVVALGLVLVSRLDPNGFRMLRGAALDVTAPLSGAARNLVGGAEGMEKSIKAYFFAASQNDALRQELAEMRRRLTAAEMRSLENRELAQAARLVEAEPHAIVTARLIGSSLTSARRYAIIFAGSNQGVEPGQPVVAADGLVGRVLESGATAARILLLTDGESTIPARLVRNGTPVLARGNGDGRLIVRALFPGTAPFRRGDVIATSGIGGIYPPDVPVAVITNVESDSGEAWPLASPEKVMFVTVLQPFAAATDKPPEKKP